MRAQFYTAALILVFTLTPSFSATIAYAQERQPAKAETQINAMLRRTITMRFDASPAKVLPQLLTRVNLYDSTVVEVRFDHSLSETPGKINVGSRRICVFADGRELVEPLIVYDPPHAYGYTVDAEVSTLPLPVRTIVLLYDFTEVQDGGTALTVRAFYDPLFPGTEAIVDPVLTGTLRRTFQAAVAVFGGVYLGDQRP